MKFILAYGFILLALTARTQYSATTIDQLVKGMQLLEKGEYQQVITATENVIEQVRKEGGESNSIYSGLFFMMGICHYKLFHFADAERNYLKQKELLAKTTGEKDKDYAACLSRLAILYRDMGRYRESIALFKQVQTITKVVLGETNPDYAACLNNLALLHADVGEYAQAEILYTQSMDIQRKAAGEETAAYASSLNNLGTLYSAMGRYEKALPLLIRVRAIREKVLGRNHAEYGEAMNNLATLYVSMGRYAEAEAPYLEAASIFKTAVGENSPSYASGINNLAQYYQTTGHYDKAEQLYMQAMLLRKKVLGEEHPDYGISLSNLAGLYVITGQIDKAEPLLIQSRDIIKKANGEDHPEYATSLNNLASMYESMGQYKKAEPLYLQALAIKKKILGENHPNYAIGLNNLAYTYFSLGQYEKTEPLFLRASEITKAAVGENNMEYATCLNNLANAWQSMEQYAKAETAYKKVISIYKMIVGPEHNDYALGLNNLANLYVEQGDFKKAEPLIIEAKDIWKKALGATSPAYATGINNVAALYRKTQSHYPEAEALYLQAIQIRKTALGEHHPYYADSQNDLALLYMQMKKFDKATPLFQASSDLLLENIAGTFSILSEKEKGKFLQYNRKMTECNNSFLYNYKQAPASVIENNYNLELGIKSLSLADTRQMLTQLRNTKDTGVRRIFNEWLAAKTFLAKQYALQETKRSPDIKRTEANAEQLEKQLNRLSSDFSNQQKALRVTVNDVRQHLKDGEAAVEFIRFKLYDQRWTDTTIYAAFIVRKDEPHPRFIPLCEKKQLQSLFDSAGTTASKLVKSFYRGLEGSAGDAPLGPDLYRLIWQPLEPYLKGIRKISYSPAGKLYSVAFHALPVDSSTILMDRYELQQYTSTREIALRDDAHISWKPTGIALFGDAQFSLDSIDLARLRDDKKRVKNNSLATRGGVNGPWSDLPGTADEVNGIGELFRSNHANAASYIHEEASEDNFKSLSGKSSPIIHIATHGFFLPDLKKKKNASEIKGNVYTVSEDPLMRSGLVFAGGNYAWAGRPPIDGLEDGIATAYEIAQLNLSSTELLVLSACETALGDIKGTEGVFGLQRGFKMAGVKKMIVSLWQVPDKPTSELMKLFYSYWFAGKTIEESFNQAQAELRKKYSPFYWAAFVLIE